MPAGERRNVKSAMAVDQRRRQRQMFERQKQGRIDRVNLARMLGQSDEVQAPNEQPPAPENDEQEAPAHADCAEGRRLSPHESGESAQGGFQRARRSVDLEEDVWAGQVMMPDWMLEAPDDMREKWLVAPRPQGQRCLIVASAGRTVARLRTGRLLQVFQSELPNGAAGRGSARICGQDATVLDCIFVAELGCYFICDVLCWKGHPLVDCTVEFRFFWLQQKLVEDAPLAAHQHPAQNPHPLHLLPWYCCDAQGLESAYRSLAVPFTRDGLQFIHRDSHYVVGLTPLMLVWKDCACSTYLSEVYKDLDPAIQVACLHVTDAGELLTHDTPPLVFARAGAELAASFARNKKRLALFKVAGISLSYPNASAHDAAHLDGAEVDDSMGVPQVAVANIEFYAPAAARRADADPLTKILFQQRLRVQPLSYEELQRHAALPWALSG